MRHFDEAVAEKATAHVVDALILLVKDGATLAEAREAVSKVLDATSSRPMEAAIKVATLAKSR